MIVATRLTVRRNERVVLQDIDVAFQAGTLTAVIGPNGAGKSTLLRALAGLSGDLSGRIEINGEPITSFDRARLGRTIAYLPQSHHVTWPVSVRCVVSLGRMPYATSLTQLSKREEVAIEQAMKAMAVAHLADRAATELSGGELARVLVARLLAQETPVLLADEPASGLDPAHGLALFEHFRKLADGGRLVVVALHDLSLALRYCDQVVLLKEGQTVAIGPSRDVLTRQQIAAVYGVNAAIGEVDGTPVVVPISVLTS